MQNCTGVTVNLPPGHHVLLRTNQTWTFALDEITIKVDKFTKYEINLCYFFVFVVCFQHLGFTSYICLVNQD